ncbi:MAG: aspartate aminotransferase family protein [Gemmatimonadota bacterium]|jgi:4-aminobutyrate aminotransferase/(S)-3-amino-2-methylpropionate transaminase|nr:MAG: aspartate aminotransferase family protein [Gemmatimonadota bacterium]
MHTTSKPPHLDGPVPARRSKELAARLAAVESPNVTFISSRFPVFWKRALGSNVWDADDNRYVDLTAAFGVAAAGHRHPAVVEAVRAQTESLVHAMGDVHPPEVRVALLERLAGMGPPGARVVLGTSGSEAVEIALKTATLFTGRPGFLAFSGAYHGLTYGALSVTDRELFRAPFIAQLNPHVVRSPYPAGGAPDASVELGQVERILAGPGGERIAGVILEPALGRGGAVFPPAGFLSGLAAICRKHGVLLVADEIYTGFGRTGWRLACDTEGVVPDLLCLGKAMSGGMPISACVGSAEVMAAWPRSQGEAMHTSTFLGHPVSCAAALAAIGLIEELDLPSRARDEGERWLRELRAMAEAHPVARDVRGRGLMIGLQLHDPHGRVPPAQITARALVEALGEGWILLGGGVTGDVITLSPALTIERDLLHMSVEMLDRVLGTCDETVRSSC